MRKFKEVLLMSLLWISAAITVGILIFILGFIFLRGYKLINIDFITKNYSASGDSGFLPMIIATLYTVVISI
ncbi:phosphate ABC transporter, permease protein PstA, partial [Clostridium sp. HCS.1]